MMDISMTSAKSRYALKEYQNDLNETKETHLFVSKYGGGEPEVYTIDGQATTGFCQVTLVIRVILR